MSTQTVICLWSVLSHVTPVLSHIIQVLSHVTPLLSHVIQVLSHVTPVLSHVIQVLTRQLIPHEHTDRDLSLIKSPEMSDVEDGGLSMIRGVGQWVAIQRQVREHVTLRETCNVIKTGGRLKDIQCSRAREPTFVSYTSWSPKHPKAGRGL